jgi:hypothetical protein
MAQVQEITNIINELENKISQTKKMNSHYKKSLSFYKKLLKIQPIELYDQTLVDEFYSAKPLMIFPSGHDSDTQITVNKYINKNSRPTKSKKLKINSLDVEV